MIFDDDHAVANVELAFVGVSSEKIGLEELAEGTIDIAPLTGRRVATLVHAMIAGATCIDLRRVRTLRRASGTLTFGPESTEYSEPTVDSSSEVCPSVLEETHGSRGATGFGKRPRPYRVSAPIDTSRDESRRQV